MVALSRVVARCLREEVRNVGEMLMLDHSPADVVAELFDLFPDISKKGIARPAADQHYRIDWYFGEVHSHGRP